MRYIAYAFAKCCISHLRYITYAFCKCCISHRWYIAYAIFNITTCICDTFPRTLALCLGSVYSERTINNASAFLICTSEVCFWFSKWHQKVEPTSCNCPYILILIKNNKTKWCLVYKYHILCIWTLFVSNCFILLIYINRDNSMPTYHGLL